jgi:GntR family transcriptional regulator
VSSRGGQGNGAAIPRRLSGRSPKGTQLRSILEDLIGTLRPGDPLPSERELAERYDLARMTVRAEITRLAGEGLVERVQGRGTFVAEPRVAQAAALSSFTEDMRARGLTAGSRVLGQETVPADAVVSRGLEIDPGAPVVRLRRVRTADGDPMALEEAFLDAARFPELADTSLEGASLFDVLENRFGVRFPTANQRVVAVEIVGEDANLLRVAPGRAGLKFHTILLDDSERPLAYAWSLFRGDRYEIRLRQERRT